MAQTLPGVAAEATTTIVDAPAVPPPTGRSRWRTIALIIGALAFLFPFYYMIVGSLQKRPDTSLRGALPMPGNLSLHNYREINAAVSLAQTLLNSVIFTAAALVACPATALASPPSPARPRAQLSVLCAAARSHISSVGACVPTTEAPGPGGGLADPGEPGRLAGNGCSSPRRLDDLQSPGGHDEQSRPNHQ
jgi:hypothetical protein